METKELKKLACDTNVTEIIKRLKNDEDQALYQKYYNRFINKSKEDYLDNPLLNDILNTYCDYYRNVFYNKVDNEESIGILANDLSKLLNIESNTSISDIEDIVEKKFNDHGYNFRGGTTSIYYGPYIWKSTKKVEYDVKIVEGEMKLPIYFMHDFIHNSWLQFLSFNLVATGGWSTNEGLHCVYERYEKDIESPKFQISFLKHEAQHNKDYQNKEWNFTVPVLEYRAKLCELHYYPDESKLEDFINTANKDSSHMHSQAEYWVINDLSKAIFNCEFVEDINIWKNKYEDVRRVAKELLLTYNRGTRNI